jgi:hypothetical protein
MSIGKPFKRPYHLAGNHEGALKSWEGRRKTPAAKVIAKRAAEYEALLASVGPADGGFTYSPTSGRQPTTGFALSIHPGHERVLPAKDVTAESLMAYVEDNWEMFQEPGTFFGAWHNPQDGKVYFDISTVVNTPEEAKALCETHQQLAYFDFSTMSSVPVTPPDKATRH